MQNIVFHVVVETIDEIQNGEPSYYAIQIHLLNICTVSLLRYSKRYSETNERFAVFRKWLKGKTIFIVWVGKLLMLCCVNLLQM